MTDTYFGEPRANETTVYQTARRGLAPILRVALPPGTVEGKVGPWVSYRPIRVNGAAYGGLVGPATDAARFVRTHLDTSACQPRLLDPATVAEMQVITTLGKP